MTEPLREPTPRVDAMLSVALKYEDITQFARTLERALAESERKLAAAERQNFDHASAIGALETELRHEEVIRKALQKVCNGLEAKLEQARQALEAASTLHHVTTLLAYPSEIAKARQDALEEAAKVCEQRMGYDETTQIARNLDARDIRALASTKGA